MDELARWLRAQLDEDRAALLRYRDGHEGPCLNHKGQDPAHYDDHDSCVLHLEASEGTPYRDAEFGLREIDAKRQLLDELLPPPREPETDSELHARFAHPAYEYRTTEGPRKQWDDTDVPPVDENGDPEPGWERNTDAGRDGWDRLDYTEESYWRRRLPEGQDRKPGAPRWLRLLAAPYADRPGYRDDWRP